MKHCWGNVFKRSLFVLTVTFFIVSAAAQAFDLPQTRRERMNDASSFSYRDSDLYRQVHESFLKEDYAGVDRFANQYLASGRSEKMNDVLYLQALSLMKLNRSFEARNKLRTLENSFRSKDQKAEAAASIADTYYYEGQKDQAYAEYKNTLERYPSSDQTAYLLSRVNELAGPLHQVATEEAGVFSVQVGSFSKPKNAKSLAEKLQKSGFDVFTEKDVKDRLYHVRVGRLSSRNDATTLESRLKKLGYPTRICP